MKFKGSIDIDQPQQVVADLFADPDNLKHYQEGFQKKVLVSGEKGRDGAVSKMYYKHGNHEMELTETITANRLPDRFDAIYNHIHMDNSMTCRFIALSDSRTRYETEVEYTRIDWIMPRLMAVLFPGMYRKPAEKWMRNFKEFAEAQGHSDG